MMVNQNLNPESFHVARHGKVAINFTCSQGFLLEEMDMTEYIRRNPPLCACGCGGRVKKGNRFIHGHNSIGRKCSEETKRKRSESLKGRIFSEEHRQKLAKAQTGKIYSKESREKMSKSHLGQSAWNKGIPQLEEIKQKISIAKTKFRIVNNGYCDQWFDFEYRKDCRKNYCEECGIKEEIKTGRDGRIYTNLHLHHKDFNKKNCHPNNLPTVCNSCHQKIHWRKRKENGKT